MCAPVLAPSRALARVPSASRVWRTGAPSARIVTRCCIRAVRALRACVARRAAPLRRPNPHQIVSVDGPHRRRSSSAAVLGWARLGEDLGAAQEAGAGLADGHRHRHGHRRHPRQPHRADFVAFLSEANAKSRSAVTSNLLSAGGACSSSCEPHPRTWRRHVAPGSRRVRGAPLTHRAEVEDQAGASVPQGRPQSRDTRLSASSRRCWSSRCVGV